MPETEKTEIAYKTSRLFNDTHEDAKQTTYSKPNQNQYESVTNYVLSIFSSSNGQSKSTTRISIDGKDIPLPIDTGSTHKVFNDSLTVTTVSISKNVDTLDNESSTNLSINLQSRNTTLNLKMP